MAKRTRRRDRLSKRKVSRRRYSKRRVSRKKNPKRKVSKRRYTKRMKGGMDGKMEELRKLLNSVGASTTYYNMLEALKQKGNSVDGAFDLITGTWTQPPPPYMKPAPALQPAPAPALEPVAGAALESAGGLAGGPDPESVQQLMVLGFNESAATKALNMHNGNVQAAANQLLSEGKELEPADELGSSEGVLPAGAGAAPSPAPVAGAALEPAQVGDVSVGDLHPGYLEETDIPPEENDKHLIYITGVNDLGGPLVDLDNFRLFIENILANIELRKEDVYFIFIDPCEDGFGGYKDHTDTERNFNTFIQRNNYNGKFLHKYFCGSSEFCRVRVSPQGVHLHNYAIIMSGFLSFSDGRGEPKTALLANDTETGKLTILSNPGYGDPTPPEVLDENLTCYIPLSMHRECFLGLSKFFSKNPDGSITHMFEKIIQKYGTDFIDKSRDLIEKRYVTDHCFYTFVHENVREATAYSLFKDEMNVLVREENPGFNIQKFDEVMVAQWKDLESAGQQKYFNMVEANEERYEAEKAAWMEELLS